jgi:hypothetical protein
MNRGLGCSYRPMESNGNIPASAVGSFIACMSLARSETEHHSSPCSPSAGLGNPLPQSVRHAYCSADITNMAAGIPRLPIRRTG